MDTGSTAAAVAAGAEQPRSTGRAALAQRLATVFSDPSAPDWQRPGPDARGRRRDALAALGLTGLSMLLLALMESFAGTVDDATPRWLGYLLVAVLVLPLALRRRWPVPILVWCSALYVASYYLTPQAAAQTGTVLGFYIALYTVVAWGGSRQAVRAVVALFLVFMIVWIAVDLTVTTSYAELIDEWDSRAGPFEPMSAYSIYSFLINGIGLGAALLLGWGSWRSALREHQNREQARQIRRQSEQLAHRAVIDERLRIARELHDVIAHHVSAIGIQAGAARKVLRRDADLAEGALRTVEESSRQAVAETRQLLGVLREDPAPVAGAPSPRGAGLQEVEELVAEHARGGLAVTLTWATSPDFDVHALPPGLSLSMYRCVQEALANVARHSTAISAAVVIRSVDGTAVELEILDRGRPRSGTSGTGYGLQGLRERVQLHGGTSEIGPRRPGPGWRVRTRFPRPDRPEHRPDRAPVARAPTGSVRWPVAERG